MVTASPSTAPALASSLLDAEPVEPVGQEADGLVVAEVGLPHPALGADAADDEAVRVLGVAFHREARVVDRARRDHHARRLHRRQAGPELVDRPAERVAELGQALAGDGADRVDVQAALLQRGADEVDQLPGVGHVDLVEDGDPQPPHQVELVAAVLGQLVLEGLDVGLRVAAGLHRRHVDDVHEDGAALDVAEELDAQALAGRGTRDQAGDVGHRVRDVARPDHAEVRHQGGERVVGDLRPRRGHGGDQRGLAGRREPDQADVGDALELDDGVEGLAGLPEQGEAGSLAAGVGQRGVAEPALAALGQHHAGAGADEVGDDPAVGRADDRSRGNAEDAVLAARAAAVAALARLAVAGLLVRAVVEVQQRVHAGVDLEDDVAAVAPVAAVGPAEGLVLLPMDRGHAVPAVAGGHVHGHTVDESGHLRRLLAVKRRERTSPKARALVWRNVRRIRPRRR